MLKKFKSEENAQTVRDLLSKVNNNTYEYPAAQRSYSYELHNEQNLIISILVGVPIDTISIVQLDPVSGRGLIVDGMHRVTALRRFSEGKFSLPSKPVNKVYMKDCFTNEGDLDLEEFGCEDLYGKSFKDLQGEFLNKKVNVCTFIPAKQEYTDDVVVSVMKIKNRSTKAMPKSRLSLVPVLYKNPLYKELWERVDPVLSSKEDPNPSDGKRVNSGWYSEFWIRCLNSGLLSTKEDLDKFASNVLSSGNTEKLKYTLWRDLFALHGHKLNLDDILPFVRKPEEDHDFPWSYTFNGLLNKTQDRLWKPVKDTTRKK